MTQDVDPEEVLSAARVYSSVHTSAASAVTELAGVLSSSAGMAGTDTGAHAWAVKYDPLSSALMDASATVVQGAGQCYSLLCATGVNHLNADEQAGFVARVDAGGIDASQARRGDVRADHDAAGGAVGSRDGCDRERQDEQPESKSARYHHPTSSQPSRRLDRGR